tara:strand:- start:53 stop:313 length:261 start_codon:yes stop_codon:yes gene_type:complete
MYPTMGVWFKTKKEERRGPGIHRVRGSERTEVMNLPGGALIKVVVTKDRTDVAAAISMQYIEFTYWDNHNDKWISQINSDAAEAAS